MHQHKLLQILSKMPIPEVKRFKKHFTQEYPNREIEQGILNKLVKHHPNYGQDKKEQEAVFKKIFPVKFDGKRRSKELGKLSEQLESYLLLQKLKESEYDKNFLLLDIYKSYGLQDLFLGKLKDLNKNLAEEKTRDHWYWAKKTALEHKDYFSSFANPYNIGAAPIYKALKSLDQYHTASILIYACEIYNRKNILSEELQALPDLAPIIEAAMASDSFYHQSYALLLQLSMHGKEEIYFSVKEKVLENLNRLPSNDQHDLINGILNYIAKKVREGDQKFLKEHFQLLPTCISQEIFITDGFFNPLQFINIVDTASKLKKYKWVADFISQWQSFLQPELKEDVLGIAQCIEWFARKKYKAVDRFLFTFRTKVIILEFQARCLAIQTNFELNELSLVENKLDSFKAFIYRREEFQPAHIKSASNFIRFVRQLIKPEPNETKLLKKLNTPQAILQKIWLQEKVQALK